jgi:hypothetical protein
VGRGDRQWPGAGARGGSGGCVDGNDGRGIYCGGGSLVVGLVVVVS